MRKISLVLVLVLCLSSFAFSAEKSRLSFGAGGGVFAGMYGVGGEMVFGLPRLDNSYLRLGLAVTDSQNLSDQDWCRFAPLCIDGIHYVHDNFYLGGGLNFPLVVSDNQAPNWGAELFLGADLESGPGKAYVEAGYSALRRLGKASFKGTHVMAGYRYGLPRISKAKAKEAPMVESPPPPPPVIVEEAPKPEKKTVDHALIATLTTKLEKIKQYITLLDKKIIRARNARNRVRVSKLQNLKAQELTRAGTIKGQIENLQ
jgi:hypothetical protein